MKIIDNRRKQETRLSEIAVGEAFEPVISRAQSTCLKVSEETENAAFDFDNNRLINLSPTSPVYRVKAIMTVSYPDTDIPTNTPPQGRG